jgi:hypothetical protein
LVKTKQIRAPGRCTSGRVGLNLQIQPEQLHRAPGLRTSGRVGLNLRIQPEQLHRPPGCCTSGQVVQQFDRVKIISKNLSQDHGVEWKEQSNEENSPTFDRRVSLLVGAATQESNVWVLSVKERKKEK